MKKLVTLLLCTALLINMSGCGSTKKGSSEFTQFAKTLPNKILSKSSMDINYLFDHPENYGIKRDVYGLDFTTLKEYKDSSKEMQKIVEDLDGYEYSDLTKDQKITYDLLKNLEDDSNIPVEDSYYLTTNYFDVSSGIQANLPLSLWNYEFKNQKSVDSFLAILKEAPIYFKKYTDLEATRQKKGYGMSKTYMEDVIKNLHTIATTDQSYILNSTYEKVDKLTFMNEQEKQSYKDSVTKLFQESFLPAFAQAEKDLSNIKILKKGEGELASYQYGKEYYESYVSEELGFKDIEEYSKYLTSQEKTIQNRMINLMREYPELISLMRDATALEKRMKNMKLTDLTSSSEVIKYLETIVSKGEDFPPIKKLEYTMNEIPATMKETTTASAAYYVSAYDDKSGKDEHMMLNGTFEQSSFPTLAHESFPGHMYQNNYFKTVKHNILRNILSSNAWTEGWATYVEQTSCKYSKDAAMCSFSNINSQSIYVSVLNLDKKIHYDGISREEAYEFLRDKFGMGEEADLSTQYEQLLENPGVFSKYYGGLYRILDLKEKAIKKWGDDYSDYRFNKALLDIGSLPMDLVEKYMKL